MIRRSEFFKVAAAAGAAACSSCSGSSAAESGNPGQDIPPLPRRPLGKTGVMLSVIGMGGIVVMNERQEHADQVVAEAVEAGVNYFDVAPTYGNAELRLGPALKPFRKNVFLACKTDRRDAEGSRKELTASLKRLQTDYLDLYQLHSITTSQDIEQIFGPGGVMETFVKARDEGLVRFLGFSAHSVEAALVAMDRFDFDTVLLPLNYITWYHGNFGPQVVLKARMKGMGVLALKSLACCPVPEGAKKPYAKCWYRPLETEEDIARALAFTLSLPVTAALPPGEEKFFRMALALAPYFVPLADYEKEELKQRAASIEPIFWYPSRET